MEKDLLDFDVDEILKKHASSPASKKEEKKIEKEAAETVEEDPGKKHVTVKVDGTEQFVSWYEGTSPEDVMEAILCACDCILDSGFELVDSDGKAVDFHQPDAIKSGETYHLYKGEELKEFKKVLGDKWRKVKIAVDALRHAEAQRAIEIMQIGANLLKYTGKGAPHIRQFQLSADMHRIIWYSGNKPAEDTVLDMKNVENVWVGVQDPALIKNTLPMLSHITFSVVYKHKGKEKRLHLTCKDEPEFDLWVCGIKALSYHFKGIPISKLDLLGHSRTFNHYIENKQVGESTKAFFEEEKEGKTKKALEDYIIRKVRSKDEIKQSYKKIAQRLAGLQEDVDEATESINLDPESKMEGYKVLTAKESEADDSTQLKNRMNELLEMCIKNNNQVLSDLEATHEEEGKDLEYEQKIKSLDAKLWKIEIDIENIADMVKRINLQGDVTWKEKFKNWFPKIF